MYNAEKDRKDLMRKINALLSRKDIEELKELHDQLRGK